MVSGEIENVYFDFRLSLPAHQSAKEDQTTNYYPRCAPRCLPPGGGEAIVETATAAATNRNHPRGYY